MASDEEEVIPVKELPEEHLDDGRSAPETPSKKPIPSTAASSRPSPPPVANGQNTRNDNKYSDKTAETQLQSEEDSDTTLSDIPDFDWEEFLQKYVRAIEAATSEEKGLISQFNHLSEASIDEFTDLILADVCIRHSRPGRTLLVNMII